MSAVTAADVVVVGAGAAGIACAVRAARAGARVVLVEKDTRIGGTLHLTGGHLAAAGTRRQRERGIDDTPQDHLDDLTRISRGTARRDLADRFVRHAAATVDWLVDLGLDLAPETPRIVHGHEPYGTPRTYYGVDAGMSLLAVLERELDHVARPGGVEVWTRAAVVGLLTDAGGRVVGVEADRAGADVEVRAPAVVLATGGYGASPELFAELEGVPLVSAASRTSTGDGIHLGLSAGARLQGQGMHLPSFGGLPDAATPGRANWADRQLLTAERPPVEIYVDARGRRWVAEDEPSIDEKERALARLDDGTFWTVFDEAALTEASGSRRRLVVGKEPDEVRAMANRRVGVHAAGSVAELALAAGIDADGLVATVAEYGEAVAAGTDPRFGRRHLPAPIATPPFYAIRNHAITLVTFQGLDVDDAMRVRSEHGVPIDGLYAVGEVIGAGATCGNSFCSGMLLTPAITFGRLLGDRLGAATRTGAA
ncbi:fumarate reductase flavoprotein subunit [Mumia flava]|uniref:Fumarate reductase flavoprotein subunit n=1 Tax=Mumia flava TaxID=1348852 RepID=A0A0B2BJU4_9ACTN|nr:FAD-dependent oxidoreductase [Mumia flava]PJJ56557.1 fumarate reductase flavoprotein subunit [Mumia flava]